VLIEFLATTRATETTLTLTASLYAVGIGVASPNRLTFGFAVFGGVLCAVAFGFVTASAGSFAGARELAIGVIALFTVAHVVEGYALHVHGRQLFFRF
jgi:hypothetical protein